MNEHILNKKFGKHVYCINLIERKDKYDNMNLKFKNLGIDVIWAQSVKYDFVNKLIPTLVKNSVAEFNIEQPNEFGAALSHYTVIKKAYLEGAESIFVFEDDCLFHRGFDILLEKCLNELPENWDMILLYSFMYKILPENIRVNKRWMKAFNSWSLLAYGMTRKMMKDYIDEQNKMFQIADKVSFKLQNNHNVYVSFPCLVIPNTKFGSDIRKEMNYNSKTIIQTNEGSLVPDVLMFGVDKNNYI